MAWGWYKKWDPQFQRWVDTYGEIPGTGGGGSTGGGPAPSPEPAPNPAPVKNDPYQDYLRRIEEEKALLKQQTEAESRLNKEAFDRQQAARERARSEALAALPGIQSQLGEDLLKQQTTAFERINPLIEQRLNALGLLQSGALPEAQAKYQKELESSRQAKLADFGTNAQQQLMIDVPLASSQADADFIKQGHLGAIDLSRAGFSRQFGLYDVYAQEQRARSEMERALEEARRARQERRSNPVSYTNFGGSYDFTPGGNSYAGNNQSYLDMLLRYT